MKKKISKTNLISCVKSSYVLDFLSSAKIWFTHIDLTNFPESITPCNSYIVEKLISFYDLDEFQYFLILVENIRTEHWHKKKDPVPYQYLIEVNLPKFCEKRASAVTFAGAQGPQVELVNVSINGVLTAILFQI